MELLIIAGAFVVLRYQLRRLSTTNHATSLAPERVSPRLVQLSEYADRLYAERKWLAAEKAYLSVLKLDHNNITAYSHLGVIYSTQKNMSDAIECFQIATRLRPSATTYQNLALAFYDNRNYMKSIAAYEKAVMFEPTASRYLGLAKAHRKLANLGAALEAIDKAIALDPAAKLTSFRHELEADHKAGA
ncbi:MAG TPA: tetratricopeptide repeat protein [Candidatus Saccharimonadia bacterium]